jgi:hypothetical protein
MSNARAERRRMEREEIEVKELLQLGNKNRCYFNSMRAVLRMPHRLQYCEGFEIGACCHNPECSQLEFNHHAKVLDTATGIVHEVSPYHEDNVKYIYRVFSADALKDFFGDRLADPSYWVPQLTMGAQQTLLVEHGYTVELWGVRESCPDPKCTCGRVHGDFLYEECPVYMRVQELSLRGNQFYQQLNDDMHATDGSWQYRWRLAAADAAAAKAGAA